MFNILLDKAPMYWKGYSIRSEFQIGIQISMALIDEELSEAERMAIACELLFVDMPEDIREATEGIRWFLDGWNHDRHKNAKEEVRVLDFDIDQWRIYSAFLNQYGLDLNRTRIHWFQFMGLLSNLNECAFTRVLDIRMKKINSKMSREEQKAIRDAQTIFRLTSSVIDHTVSAERTEAIGRFNEFRGRK